MEYGAIDLHLRRSQFRIVQADGTVVKDGKFGTTRADLCRRAGRAADARAAYKRALALARQEPERRFLESRLGELPD